jgi:superfamily I DNA/RNA helicase
LLKSIGDKQSVSAEELNTLFDSLSLDQNEIKADYLRERILGGRRAPQKYPGIKKIPITGTTVQSSKGLAADYVFITHFDQRYLPGEDGITDQSICSVLVALTRARKKVWLISTTDRSSEFLDWIDKNRIRRE